MPTDPSSLHITYYPDPVLRRKAAPIEQITDEVRAVAGRMIELMREADGIGLAAPQVGLGWRMFVVHVRPGDGRDPDGDPPSALNQPRVYINPEILSPEGPPELASEGCLSLPDVQGGVLRPPTVTIRAKNLEGEVFTQRATGMLARCFQHEYDHLDGVLIIDRMGQMDRLRNRSLVRAMERDAGVR